MIEINMLVTGVFLQQNPHCIFVFGDNTIRQGKGGAAALRDFSNTYGFITKKLPLHENSAFYTVDEYKSIYVDELLKLELEIKKNPKSIYMISQLGAGLANRFGIWEEIIKPNLKDDLGLYNNIIWLY